ncbi:MAG TPA: primosomal protein N', partial [Gemmatimonadaceae bacterium]|nr:primosomal protein N' [Gemmatimonadaceae bacterium]
SHLPRDSGSSAWRLLLNARQAGAPASGPMTPADTTLVEVALAVPLFQTFRYAIDPALPVRPEPGSRVVVPFRNRKEIGICLGPASAEGLRQKPKRIIDVPDALPSLSATMIELCRWMADYYVVPLGLALRAALPSAMTGAEQPQPARKTRRIVRLRQDLPTLTHREKAFARAPQQRAVFEMLESLGGSSTVDHLQEKLAFSPSVLKGLERRGLIDIEAEEVDRDPFALRATRAGKVLEPTSSQAKSISALTKGGPGDVFLLHGITGSGKTLVYIELLREIVDGRGQTGIVLVPEIALTPQTVDRFRAVFGDRIAVLHSALSEGERYDAWLALQKGEKKIAVGARSAIFAPLANVGAIIVDEEHEASYKQGETPRYHAREVAIVRARAEGAVVVLGSATPSLESWTNAASGKYTLLALPDRVGGGTLPRIDIVDLRHREVGSPDSSRGPGTGYSAVIREELDAALAKTLQRGEQSILLLNRRGYSSFVQCNDCGDVVVCPNCSITLTHHRSPERLLCHYCSHQEPLRARCARCSGQTLKQRGLGTQQIERLVCDRFSSARIARMDVDTTSGKWAHAEILDRVGSGEVDILLGTQMIAKGLDFPNVTLVGVVDADVGINLPDFRASERCFQLLSQVAGRAGRGPKGGRVLIQTRVPAHHAVRCAVTHDYTSFVNEELEGRANPLYPPNLRLINIVFSGTNDRTTSALAIRGADWIRDLISSHTAGEVTTVGPAPCPIERVKNRWRWHLVLKSSNPSAMTRVSRYFMERFKVPAALRVTLDRDPVALL